MNYFENYDFIKSIFENNSDNDKIVFLGNKLKKFCNKHKKLCIPVIVFAILGILWGLYFMINSRWISFTSLIIAYFMPSFKTMLLVYSSVALINAVLVYIVCRLAISGIENSNLKYVNYAKILSASYLLILILGSLALGFYMFFESYDTDVLVNIVVNTVFYFLYVYIFSFRFLKHSEEYIKNAKEYLSKNEERDSLYEIM